MSSIWASKRFQQACYIASKRRKKLRTFPKNRRSNAHFLLIKRLAQKRATGHAKSMTPAEKKFKASILKPLAFKFKFCFHTQHILWIGKYRYRIVDFYIGKPYKLAIEIDGDYHLAVSKYDRLKDQLALKYCQVKTLRFTNEDVFTRRNMIVEELTKRLGF